MDNLDDALIEGFLNVSSAQQLDALIGPYAAPEKMIALKTACEVNPDKEFWLKRVILGAQSELRKELKAAGALEQKEGGDKGEK